MNFRRLLLVFLVRKKRSYPILLDSSVVVNEYGLQQSFLNLIVLPGPLASKTSGEISK